MSSICPNINLQEWKDLELAVGKLEAYRDFMQTNGEIRTPQIVQAKIDAEKEEALLAAKEPTLIPVQKDLFEGQALNIAQNAVPGSPSETSIMTQALRNDKRDNSVEPELTDHTAAVELVNAMSGMLGIGYQIVTAAEAKKITANAKNPWNAGDLSFFVGGRVYFVGDNLSMNNVFHEFSHPFVRHLQNTNPELISNLYLQLKATPEGQSIIEEVRELYPELDALHGLFKEEVIVKALTVAGLAKIEKLKLQSGFAKAINEILYSIKQMIRRVFGKASPISTLDADTTLEELAAILTKGGEIQLDVEKISQDDIVAYNKERAEFISEMNTVPESTMQKQINDFAEITTDHINKLLVDENYRELAAILKDVTEQSDLEAIGTNLRAYQTNVATSAKKTVKDINDVTAQSTAFVNSLFRLDMVMNKIYEHVADIHKEGESQDNLHKGYYYLHLIEHWEGFSASARKGLTESGIDRTSPLIALLGQIDTSIANSKDLINEMQAVGARDTLYAELMPMHENIKARYDKRIERLEKSNAPQARIDREYKAYHGITKDEVAKLNALENRTGLSRTDQAEKERLKRESFNGVAISPEKIELILKGGIKDANFFNSYLEGYLYNTDPVIGGLASYVKNHLNEVMVTVQVKYNRFAKDIQPKLEKAGVNQYRPGELGEKVGFLDKVGMLVDGQIEQKEVWTFLNPFKDYRLDEATYKQDVENTKRAYQDSGTAEAEAAMVSAIAAQKQFKRNYFHQRYTNEYYAAEQILYRGEGDIVGEQAILAKDRWKEEMLALTEPANTAEQQLAISDEQAVLWREYRQLRSRYYLNGQLKKDDAEKGIYDASIAARLRDHQKATRDFSEWVPKKGSFQNALRLYEQEIIDTGVAEEGSDQFDALRQVWINKNVVKAPLQSYYDAQRRDYERMTEIYSKLPKSEQEKLNESVIHEQISDLTRGFKDEEGQIKANEMTLEARQEVKSLEEQLIVLKKAAAKRNGLTTAQNDRFGELFEIKKSGKWSNDLARELNMLYDLKKEFGLSDFEIRELSNIQARLSGLSKREATDYYVDTMNEWLGKLDVKEETVQQIDKASADWVLQPAVIKSLLGQDAEFDKWFKENHIQKELYDKAAKGLVKQWVRTRVWSLTVPTDSTQFETTDIYDQDGNVIEVIQGKPILKYYNNIVKPAYRNDKIEGVTVDNQGKWLPKTIDQGALTDKYRNEKYYETQKDPAMYDVLETLKKHHLENQQGLNYRGRLYLDFPRYRKSNLELVQDGNLLTNLAQRIKDWFQGAADDAEDGFNDAAEFDLIRTDIFDNAVTKVPIHGLYNVDQEDVSTNITHTMMQYMLSGERQKQLVKISPIVRAVQSVVTTEGQNQTNSKGIDQIDKSNFYNNSIKLYKKMSGDGVRKKAIDNFIKREFEGERMVGAGSDVPWLNNTASLLFKRASFGFFAFNIPSAMKNAWGAKFQGLIEASAGEHMTHTSFQKGNAWSYGTMAELSFGGQLYQKGPKSLRQQTVEIFDPSQGRFEETLGEGLSRTIAKDVASFDWLYNFRKWVELQATLQIFGGMMYHKKVEMTLSDGTKKEIPYMDAWEMRDEQIQLKKGVDPKWGITIGEDGKIQVGDEFKRYKNTVHQVMNNLQGAYSSFDQPEAQRYLVFRFLSYLRRYFTTMTLNRFGFSGRWQDPQPRLNPGLGDVQTGFYITFIKLARDTVANLGQNLMYMTDVEKQAAMRVITEVGLLAATGVAMSLLFGWDEDDEDKFEKLRERSGSLPFPMVSNDPDRPFNGWGFVENHMLFLLMNVRAENEQFLPLPDYGLDDYSAMLDLKSIAFGPTIKTYKDIFEDALDIMEGNESANYKRKVGPYVWQEEGGTKIFSHLTRTLGLTGSALDPAKGIQGFQSVKARAR